MMLCLLLQLALLLKFYLGQKKKAGIDMHHRAEAVKVRKQLEVMPEKILKRLA
jgi:hypothetical protein